MKQATHTARLAPLTLCLGLVGLGLAQTPGGVTDTPPAPELAPVIELLGNVGEGRTPEPATRDIDLAICLDTSGSMTGLIESAKQRLWALVNDLALALQARFSS